MVEEDPRAVVAMLRMESPSPEIHWGIRFMRQADRFCHELFVEDQEEARVLIRSLEGEDSQRWPASPALQQLDLCSLPHARQGVVGVGSAGTSHWSLSVESDAAAGLIRFDAACRVKTAPDLLGSTYELAAPPIGHELRSSSIRWQLEDGGEISISAGEPEIRIRWEPGVQRVVIEPRHAISPWPATVRWQYQLQYTARPRGPT